MNIKILLLTTFFISLIGCKSLTSSPLNQAIVSSKSDETQKLTLVTNDNELIGTLMTDDNWETATFVELNKNVYNLTRAVSANGIKLNNGPVVIHFKGKEGILEKNSIVTNFLIK